MKLQRQKEIVEEILGTPLPILDPIYYEGAKLYQNTSLNQYMTPYVLHELFTPEEMKMVLCLPASSKEIAEKMNLSESYVEGKMQRLLKFGRILPLQDYHLELNGYSVMVQPMVLRDRVAQAYNAMNLDWNLEGTMFKLVDAWGIITEYYDSEYKDEVEKSYWRVIPKWESIKNIPGVMYSENMYEIMNSFREKGEFSTLRCICKQYKPFVKNGTYPPDNCESGIVEYDNKTGHCLFFGERAKYFKDLFNAYMPTKEEMIQKLKEIDESTLVYGCRNGRRINFICTCCKDCCCVLYYQNMGYNRYISSRFKPEFDESKCLSCGKCFKKCVFNAIELKDRKPIINLDKCMGCGNCVVGCPGKALKMKIVKDVDWIPEL